jgi:hypothetical protein
MTDISVKHVESLLKEHGLPLGAVVEWDDRRE